MVFYCVILAAFINDRIYSLKNSCNSKSSIDAVIFLKKQVNTFQRLILINFTITKEIFQR